MTNGTVAPLPLTTNTGFEHVNETVKKSPVLKVVCVMTSPKRSCVMSVEETVGTTPSTVQVPTIELLNVRVGVSVAGVKETTAAV